MCLFPIKAWRCCDSETGENHIVFKYPGSSSAGFEPLTLPCGKCVECLQSYSTEWAVRCMFESRLHTFNCMITLTYADAPKSVCRRDLQLFIKRLRRRIEPVKIRYFGCGEYGKKGARPHYHIIIFGWRPDDLEKFFFRDGHWVYKSAFVARVWDLGFISVEDVTWQSAKYTAKYLQKLQTLRPEQQPPFTCMSLKPGIGLDAFDPSWLDSDKVYLEGRTYSIPRYFRRKYPGDYSEQSALRKLRGKLLNSSLLDRRKLAIQRFGTISL